MNESSRIETLKENCLQLFQLKDDYRKYEKETIKMEDNVRSLKLEHLIDSGELAFFLMRPVRGKQVSELNHSEFQAALDEYFTVKKVDYYFQITEVKDFPDNYRLGHGILLTFASLPQQVKSAAISLSKHDTEGIPLSTQNSWKQTFEKLLIPVDPNLGHWLKISYSSISGNVGSDRAFEYAEESLDILRIAASPASFHLPQCAIAWNTNKNAASPTVKGIGFSKYSYSTRHLHTIDRLNDMYVKPSSEIERRIKDAIHFLRIADNNSPNYQRLFYYVAAIERLILGDDDRGVLGKRFSQKGAILLSDDLTQRLDIAIELKKIYNARNKIAHGEKPDYDFFLTTTCQNYLRTILMEMIYLIDTYGLRTIARKKGKMGESLDEYLDIIIYSGVNLG